MQTGGTDVLGSGGCGFAAGEGVVTLPLPAKFERILFGGMLLVVVVLVGGAAEALSAGHF